MKTFYFFAPEGKQIFQKKGQPPHPRISMVRPLGLGHFVGKEPLLWKMKWHSYLQSSALLNVCVYGKNTLF